MKLSEYAKKHSVTYRTAWNRFKAGKIKNAVKDNTGHVYILEDKDLLDYSQCAIYCRVSSNKQKEDLVRQVERVKSYAITNGYSITEITSEVGSGVNDNRAKLLKLFKSTKWNTLIVEHADRLTRFGFNYIKTLLELNNKKVVVINTAADGKSDLMQDMISVLYSFSARMYGKRKSSKATIKKALEQLK